MAKRAQIRIKQARIIKDALKRFDHDMIFFVYEVDGVEVRELYWSGKYNGPVKQLARHLHRFASKLRVDVITTTESQQPGARKVVRAWFGKRWGVDRAGEYLCIWRKASFRRVKAPHVRVFTRVANYALWRQMHVGVFNLRHRQIKRRWRILAVHGPSAIQSGAGFRRGKQAEIAWKGWPKVGRRVAKFARNHPRAVQVIPADCNASLRLAYWMNWFEAQTRSTCVWRNQVPNEGTHAGGRLIDAAWIFNAKPAERKKAA